MIYMEPLTAPHSANITRKAERAVDAIKIIADTILIPSDDWPGITGRIGAIAYLADVLFDRANSEGLAWWATIGVLHDAAQGKTVYGIGEGGRIEQPTTFNTSRPVIKDMLDGIVWAAAKVPADPFAGLGGEPF